MSNAPRRDKSCASREDGYFSLCLWHRTGCVFNVAAEGLQRRMEMMERLQHQEVQVKES